MRNFKKVILTILLFLLAEVVFSCLIMTAYFRGENYYYQDIRERDELSGTIDFLVSGSSHAMSGFNTEILDEDLGVNSYNLSYAASTMEGRYELLKLELERNPVDTVVIGLSYNMLTKSDKDKGYEGDYYMLSKLKFWRRTLYFFKVLPPSEYARFYYNCLEDGYECLKMLFNGTWTNKNEESYKGFIPYNEGNPDKSWIVEDYAAAYNTMAFPEEVDADSLEYLNKILDLCEEKEIQVILVTVAIPESNICRYSNLDVFREWYVQIAEERGLTFIDFNLYKENFELFQERDDFNDDTHLSAAGAEKFTELFVEVYDMIQNGEDFSDLFYDSYDELEYYAGYTGK